MTSTWLIRDTQPDVSKPEAAPTESAQASIITVTDAVATVTVVVMEAVMEAVMVNNRAVMVNNRAVMGNSRADMVVEASMAVDMVENAHHTDKKDLTTPAGNTTRDTIRTENADMEMVDTEKTTITDKIMFDILLIDCI